VKLLSIAESGLKAAQVRLEASAHNVANAATPGFRGLQVTSQPQVGGGVETQWVQNPEAGVDLAAELVQQRAATYDAQANLKMVTIADRFMGSLLDVKG
jgi:flagellar hook protein FlgE